jgi:hypothetical protein
MEMLLSRAEIAVKNGIEIQIFAAYYLYSNSNNTIRNVFA